MYKEIVDFIREIYKTNEFIPLHKPYFGGKEKEYVLDTIDSTLVSSVGGYVDRVENEISKLTKANYTVATANGTAALHIALLVVGVRKETEVLTQPLTFVATCNAIAYIGAVPNFVDVDLDTMGLSPVVLKKYLEQIAIVKDGVCYNKKTNRVISACVPMHTFGHACKIEEIVNICNEYHIPVVEDAAEAVGSYYRGKHLGIFGKLGVFSFNGNKIITSGGGGAIVTSDKKIAQKVKHLTTTAKLPHSYEYVHDVVGYNYRMPNINAALLVAQLEQLNSFLSEKKKLVKIYKEYFKNTKEILFRESPRDSDSNYWLMALQFKDEKSKETFLEYTNANEVMTRPIWKLMSSLKMYKDAPKTDLKNSDFFEKRIVNIPSSIIK